MLESLKEFLDKTNDLIKHGTYARPKTIFQCQQYLTDNKSAEVNILNVYEDEMSAGYTVIIHGHKYGVPCAAPHMCHEAGYQPSDIYYPAFRRIFNQKWGKKKNEERRMVRNPVLDIDFDFSSEL